MLAMPMVFLVTLAIGTPLGVTRGFEITPSPRIAMIWMAGAAGVYLYRFAGWVAVQRLRHRAICIAPVEWRERLADLAQKIDLRGRVTLLESALAETPLVIGWLRPAILIPAGLLAGLPAAQAEAILLHELAHIARRDYLVNLLQAAVEGLLFYHPAVWWVSHVIRRERELCCDDRVIAIVGDATAYAQALAALEQHRYQLALASTGGPLMYRIHRLLGRPASRFASLGPALIALVAGTVMLLAHPQQPPQESQPVLPEAAPAPAPVAQPRQVIMPKLPVRQVPKPAVENEIRADVESPYNRWLTEEVVWLISDSERREFQALPDDETRQAFIEQFWLRRDPTPGTDANELKEEYYRRIAWANDRFASAIPGWKTDRGMFYVTFGPPDEREEHPAEAGRSSTEKWHYRVIEGMGSNVTFEFVDQAFSAMSGTMSRPTPSTERTPLERMRFVNQPSQPANQE